MASEKSPIIQIQNPPNQSKTKGTIKRKKSNANFPPPTIIYVPVLVQSLPSADKTGTSSSGTVPTVTTKSSKAVLTDQQMLEWRCQADGCTAMAATTGRYYLRHRICDEHSKTPCVLVNGLNQRYCQQCSRFHELSEFDGSRRSCRRQLCRRRLLRSLNTLPNEDNQI